MSFTTKIRINVSYFFVFKKKMSFWKTFGFQTVSAIDNLLDSGNFTLEQLLDEEDILQETKAQNKKLIDL